MERKDQILEILNSWTWSESENTYISLTAFDSQIELMNSFRNQFNTKGDLSDKQIETAKKIIEQNRKFSQTFRLSRI
jgi:hypothetical protein